MLRLRSIADIHPWRLCQSLGRGVRMGSERWHHFFFNCLLSPKKCCASSHTTDLHKIPPTLEIFLILTHFSHFFTILGSVTYFQFFNFPYTTGQAFIFFNVLKGYITKSVYDIPINHHSEFDVQKCNCEVPYKKPTDYGLQITLHLIIMDTYMTYLLLNLLVESCLDPLYNRVTFYTDLFLSK